MLTKKEAKLLTELLNLEGVKVATKHQYEGIGIILGIESNEKISVCRRCGLKSDKLHQNHRQIIKDLDWAEQALFLEVNRRQFNCEKCQKPFSEELEFVKERRSYTKRLANKIIEEVLADDIRRWAGDPSSTVAKRGRVTEKEIERMLKDASTDLSKIKPTGLKRLGIDEIALIKGQGKYCAVLIDIDRSKLLAIVEGRTKEEIKEVLIEWGSEVLEGIEEVSIDLWKGYKSLVTEMIPNAQIVADRFHVMAQINQELDGERKKEKRKMESDIKQAKTPEEKLEKETILAGINNSKYAILKNEKDLSEEQKEKLLQIQNLSSRLKIMHQLKEEFRDIFEKTEKWNDGLLGLGKWLSKAQKYFVKSQSTIYRWFDEILAYFNNRTSSGVVEGINNKLKLIKRSGYGFRNFNNFRNRCLLNWHFNH
jgi:transposase